jgi:hypothetical protein
LNDGWSPSPEVPAASRITALEDVTGGALHVFVVAMRDTSATPELAEELRQMWVRCSARRSGRQRALRRHVAEDPQRNGRAARACALALGEDPGGPASLEARRARLGAPRTEKALDLDEFGRGSVPCTGGRRIT